MTNKTIENELQTWKVIGLLKPNNLDILCHLLYEKYPTIITLCELKTFLFNRNKDANFWYDMILERYSECVQFEEEIIL